jgi:hypothetical protein
MTKNLPPYAPVRENELAIHGDGGADLRFLNAISDAGEQAGVACETAVLLVINPSSCALPEISRSGPIRR